MTLVQTPVKPAERQTTFARTLGEGLPNPAPEAWTAYGKAAFRFFFIYFGIQAVPLDLEYYRDLFRLEWSSLHFGNFFYLARYAPRIFSDVPVFADWLAIAVIALVSTVTWSIIDAKAKSYNRLYYWLRVILRYRLAAALLAYGFIKFFPMQMPYPSISSLNTNYGDIAAWKLFSMSTGIVPGYESFLGIVEIAAALLLLHRKTASIGAFLVLPFTGNVVLSNLAYEGGEYVYALLLVTFAVFLVTYDAVRLVRLTSLEKPVRPASYKPVFREPWIRNSRLLLKSAFVFVFVFFYGYQTGSAYREGGYHFPATPGLGKTSGIYTVTEFRINDRLIPFSVNDPVRWRDVVFERWATLSIRSRRPVTLATAATEEIFTNDRYKTYEWSGIAGRHYYNYEADTVNQTLTLRNQNKNYVETFVLNYRRPDAGTITLSGVDHNNDSIYVVLEKQDKKYLLEEAARHGRRKGLKL